jgi:hypothetical protein
MTWSRFDDGARKHPKAQMAGNEAWALWCAAVMYCNQYGTDGFVPEAALATELLPLAISPAKAKKLAQSLCEAKIHPEKPGLFVRDAKRKGYIVHDFLHWNPSKAEVDAKRKKDRERKRGRSDDGPEGSVSQPSDPSEPAKDSAWNPDGGNTESSMDSAGPTRAPAPAGPGARAEPSPPAQPAVPAQPDGSNLRASSQDLTGTARPAEPERAGGPACPPDLWSHVPEPTRATLEMLGPSREVQELHCRQFAADKAHRTDIGRSVERWISTWQKALRTDWSDSNKARALRREVEAKPEPPDEIRRRREAAEAAETERLRREVAEHVGSSTPPAEAKAKVEGFLVSFGR